MTNNTIPNVPRELLEELRDAANESMNATTRQHQIDHFAGLIAKADALLSAPSPAGVDGLKRYEVFPYLDDEVAEMDICESDDGTFVKYDDAHAIIDGLRGEVAKINSDRLACWAEFKVMTRACLDAEKERDQHSQRICELGGLLREVAASLAWIAHGECRAIHDGPIMPSQMALDAVKAALGGQHERR